MHSHNLHIERCTVVNIGYTYRLRCLRKTKVCKNISSKVMFKYYLLCRLFNVFLNIVFGYTALQALVVYQ